MEFEAVIGLEVHVEISTRSKVFCACKNDFHAPPNTNVCPVCLGMPGVLPVLNRAMVDASVAVGLALECSIARWSKMDRKNYFYPDMAKNYQISQYDLPLCRDGHLDIEAGGETKRIRIRRAHMEEDTARNSHTLGPGVSGVDFNRAGVPLLEIVTEPDIHSAEEAYAYLTALKQILLYLGVSDCNMEEGSLRAEPNISLRPKDASELGVKTEVKNVASFSGVQKAIEFEIKRQAKVLREGGRVQQETRGWDADRGVTLSQRAKESAHDYRYFPEPDLVPIVVDEAWERRIRDSLPELPHARRQRFVEEYGLTPYDAEVLTAARSTADYFEATVAEGAPAKPAANWIMSELQAFLVKSGGDLSLTVQAYVLLNLYVIVEEAGAEIIRLPSTPRGKVIAMQAAARLGSPVIDELADATKQLIRLNNEITNTSGSDLSLLEGKKSQRQIALKRLRDAMAPVAHALEALTSAAFTKTSPKNLARLILLIETGVISGKIGKEVLAEMHGSGKSPDEIVRARGLVQISDESAIAATIRDVLAQHPGPVAEFRSGKAKAKGFLVGQVMRAMQGKGNPQVINRILDEQLAKE